MLDEIVARSLGPQRFNMMLLGGLALLALLLAAVGLYGMLSHLVSQQMREIGVRMALGATQATVVGHVLRQAMGMVVVGMAAGVIGAFGLTRVLRNLLTDVGATDTWSFTLAALTLTGVAAVAATLPAWRAARVDPIQVLRD